MRGILVNQCNVLYALILRELQTRFGEYQLGMLWALLEPALQVSVFYLVFSFAKKASFGTADILVFLTVSFVPWIFFSSILGRIRGAIPANKGLFNYKPVKPIDTVIARILLEFMIYVFVYIFLLSGLGYFGLDVKIENFLGLVGAWCLFALFGGSLGLYLMILETKMPFVKQVVNVIKRFLFFASGVFYTADSIPNPAREILILNPILQFMELFRGVYFDSFTLENVDLMYIGLLTLSLMFLGLLTYWNNRFNLVKLG